jgi:hypothetical protein
MLVNVVACDAVMNALFTFVVPFTTLIVVPFAAALMFIVCAEKVCSALNTNVEVSLITALQSGNRICWAKRILAQGWSTYPHVL